MSTWVYLATCAIAPMAWGFVAVAVFRWIGRRFPPPPARERDIDYHI